MHEQNDSWPRLARNTLIILSIALLPIGNVVADSSLLYPPNAQVFGKKMSEWSAEWWQYILATPTDPNPLLDLTGNNCTLVQHGPVWFLEGATRGPGNVIRTCSIPEGKALFFPILNLVDINVTNQPADELRAEIVGCLDPATNLSLALDGQNIPVGASSRVRSVSFAAVLPPNGVPTIPPTPAGIYSPSVDDGYYVMLRPLAVGQHTLHFTGASPGCDYSPTNFHVDPFSADVTYHLTVTPVSLE